MRNQIQTLLPTIASLNNTSKELRHNMMMDGKVYSAIVGNKSAYVLRL